MTLASRASGGVVAVNLTTGGSGYSSAVTVSFTGGGGTGAAAVAHMVGTAVDSIVITNAGTGYTSAPSVVITAATGSGAAAGAAIYAGDIRPMSFFQGRDGEVYGVDGMRRGIRIDCSATQAVDIGVEKPSTKPTITAATTYTKQYLSAIQIVREGAGYFATPSVTITGGTPTTPAKARAVMRDGRIASVVVVERGAGFSDTPKIEFAGGFPTAATFGVSVSGGVRGVSVVKSGFGYVPRAKELKDGNGAVIGYLLPATVQFSTAQGLTGAHAIPICGDLGDVQSIQLLAAGTGATTTGVTATIVQGVAINSDGTAWSGGAVVAAPLQAATLAVEMFYGVSSVTAVTAGTSHKVPPVCSVLAATADPNGGGAIVTASVTNGTVNACTVVNGGYYSLPPTCIITDTKAEAVAVMEPPLRGRYYCAVRYIDQSGEGDPIPSSISDLAEVDVPDGSDSLTWTVSHASVDARVTAMELWRTTADQAVVLFKVATIKKTDAEWSSGYTDTKPDWELQDTSLPGYGLMPITLPSGQLNARRFGVLPGNYGVGVMFQDRAWFAVDTTGERPNSLLFSEVDEPESVPEENEILLQESVGERDSIVALIPLSSELLIVQTGHLYSLRYVAQPIIDASIALSAYRGVLNNSCWTVMGGVAFIADSYGIYAFDGQKETPISVAVDNYFRDGIVDFSKKSQFHMSSDFNSKVVRFHYCKSTDSAPTRALCYCVATETWWEETYHAAITASAPAVIAGRRTTVYGTGGGSFVRPVIGADVGGATIPWQYRSGNFALKDEPNRSIGILYTPTASTCNLELSLHFNGQMAARTNAGLSDRGTGFVSTAGSTMAVLNMAAARSPLGTAPGYAQAMFAGRLDPRSAGADRHVAVACAGTQGAGEVKLHGITVEGAG